MLAECQGELPLRPLAEEVAVANRKRKENSVEWALGQWEWVALPEFGISCMRAQLTPESAVSLLAAEELCRESEEERTVDFEIAAAWKALRK